MTSLALVLEQAERERDQAEAALRRALQAAQQVQAQLQQLQAYRREMQARWVDAAHEPRSTEMLHHWRNFRQRLDEAIALVETQQGRAEAEVQRTRALHLACETRVAAIGKLAERRAGEQRRISERQEQRLTDEAAQRARRLGAMTLH